MINTYTLDSVKQLKLLCLSICDYLLFIFGIWNNSYCE
jgi:hypothetical protein